MNTESYRRLTQRFATICDLEAAAATIEWYSRCHAPRGGQEGRGQQMATLMGKAHELLVAPECEEDLANAEVDEPWHAANLREMRWHHVRGAAVPVDLVEAEARAASRALAVWETAKPNGDFAAFLPALRELLRRVRARAEVQGETLGISPYDALLDAHDPGRRSVDVEVMFKDLEAALPGMIKQVRGGPKPLGPTGKKKHLKRIAKRLMAMLGLEDKFVRLDKSPHPFTIGWPEDVRITTRYSGPPGEAVMAVLHESGHGIYIRNLPRLDGSYRQPVCMARGMTVHESQSLSIEMFACRSRPFTEFFARLLEEELGEEGSWTPERLYAVLTHVEPGLVRVNADELTYQMHIAARFRCENALISGTLDPADLPDAFDDSIEALLGIRPADPGEGCLQDMHWASCHGWGYFPTYTLGALMAAQLAETMEPALPDLEYDISQGNFAPLVSWLKENVHSRGCFDPSSDALLEQVTGRPLGADSYLRHAKRRYAGSR